MSFPPEPLPLEWRPRLPAGLVGMVFSFRRKKPSPGGCPPRLQECLLEHIEGVGLCRGPRQIVLVATVRISLLTQLVSQFAEYPGEQTAPGMGPALPLF